ncbi:MAG: alpha/beta hydrolase [Candidatus Gracilibacteria bacterium]|nr:alpha/beta hydrolase [Candidatus Gracilibacteria bacterium]
MITSSPKHQIIFIHGGETFDSDAAYMDFLARWEYDPCKRFPSWKKWVMDGLSDRFESFTPDMPCKQKAEYGAWKIWFEKLFPYLGDQKTILVGHSLGGIFVAKYLSENTFTKRLAQVHLIAPVLDNEGLVGESVGSFVFDPKHLPNLASQSDEVHIWSSLDDPVVPRSHAERYHAAIPGSELHTFSDRGHFFGQPSFVELFLEIGKVV